MKMFVLAALLAVSPVSFAGAAAPNPNTSWAVNHAPAAAAAATISKAAVTGVRHVATSVTICISAVAAQGTLQFNLRDGATGAGTVVWTARLMGVIGTGQCLSMPVFIVGTKGTAMTLESAAAPAATNFATVSLTGYDDFTN